MSLQLTDLLYANLLIKKTGIWYVDNEYLLKIDTY